MIKLSSNFILLVIGLILSLTGCQGSSGGGFTIAQTDNTGPTLTLGAGQSGGQDVTVSADGSAQSMTLISKTGPLTLTATAKDSESGVQALEIWVGKKTTVCDANEVCTIEQPVLGKAFESTSPQKTPGQTTAESSILIQALDLSKQIPQGSPAPGSKIIVEFVMHAVAINHLGGRTQTPTLTATWTEP